MLGLIQIGFLLTDQRFQSIDIAVLCSKLAVLGLHFLTGLHTPLLVLCLDSFQLLDLLLACIQVEVLLRLILLLLCCIIIVLFLSSPLRIIILGVFEPANNRVRTAVIRTNKAKHLLVVILVDISLIGIQPCADYTLSVVQVFICVVSVIVGG